MSARTCDEKIAKWCCGYSPKQKIIGTRNWFLPAIGYLTIYGHGRAPSTSPSVLLRLYRRRANYWKRSTTARMHFFFLRVLKASAGRSPKRRPAAAPYFVLMRRRCRKSPVAQPCSAISPMKMDSRKICYGCGIRLRAKHIVSSVCGMPRASAGKKWRNNTSPFIASWEWPHEEFSPAHFIAVAVENAARLPRTATWFPDSSHCPHHRHRAESPGLAPDYRGRLLFCRQQQRCAGGVGPSRLLRAGREIASEQDLHADASPLRWRARTRT